MSLQPFLSTFLAVIVMAWHIAPAAAHETRATVADVTVTTDTVLLEMAITLEPLVAGIDQSAISDTNDSDRSDEHDRLRALEPAEFEAAFRAAWQELRERIRVEAVETLALEIKEIEIDVVGNVELPRDTRLVLIGSLPEGNTPVTVGWDAAFGDLVVRQFGDGEGGYSAFLTGGATSAPLSRTGSAGDGAVSAFIRYVVSGFEQFVPRGLDHVLFVLGLFFFLPALRPLVLQVTSFTVSHSLALALAALDIVRIPASLVEPLIALSIAYIALENILGGQISSRRLAIVFAFGLLHGVGLAIALRDIGLGGEWLLVKLLGFNLGVELGQIAVILVAWLIVGRWFSKRAWYRLGIAVPASAVIGLIGLYLVNERAFA